MSAMSEGELKEEWANVNRVMELVKGEGDAACERAFDFLLADGAAVRAERDAARSEWNRTKPIDAEPACVGCGGPHPFDTTVPSPTWNRVIRGAGLPDYLCTTCIVRAFVTAGESFTAEVWSPEFNGVPIEVRVASADAKTAADLGDENTALRVQLAAAHAALREVERDLDSGFIGQDSVRAERNRERLLKAVRAALSTPEGL